MKQIGPLTVALPLTLLVVGCAGLGVDSPDRQRQYVVTASPIDLGIGSGRFCVAVDPKDPQGVWWWEPGNDCTTRSTGPAVFHAERASVSTSVVSGVTPFTFRIPLKRAANAAEPPFVDLQLKLEPGFMEASATGSRVATTVRRDLDIPDGLR